MTTDFQGVLGWTLELWAGSKDGLGYGMVKDNMELGQGTR